MGLSYGGFGRAVERLGAFVAAAGAMMAMSGPVSAQTANVADVKPIKMAVLGDSSPPVMACRPRRRFRFAAEGARRKGHRHRDHNAGVSGDTTTGGLARLEWSIPPGTEAVIVELGANDALRGVDPSVARGALDDILTKLKARNIAVLLCGMYAPPNYGADYTAKFNSIYPSLPRSTKCRCIRSFSTASPPWRSSPSPTACIRPPRASMLSWSGFCPRLRRF
jgi:acyl-CoA thioesterase-1